MMWLKRIPLTVAGVVLLGAIALQAFDPTREISRAKPAHLANALPQQIPGWVVTDVPLGPNEFLQEKVAATLNFDDVLNRRYVRGDVEIGVYIAYWGAGKMPTRLVASHTPDRCWTENGWTCLDMRFDERLNVGSVALQPADWREFRAPNGEITYVLFWHLMEGRAYDYGERFNNVPSPVEWWKDAVAQVIHGSREQYFVRISSPTPFEDVRGDVGVEAVFAALADLGLAEREVGK